MVSSDDIRNWKQRIEDDPALLSDGIDWMSEKEMNEGESSDNTIDSVILRTLCKAKGTGFTPSSEAMEGLDDHFDLVIGEYSEHKAQEEEDDAVEASCDRRNGELQ